MPEQERGVCSYKKCCKQCEMVSEPDRPIMCVSLECELYTPCTQCGQNRSLSDKGLCLACVGRPKPKNITERREEFHKSQLASDGYDVTEPPREPSQPIVQPDEAPPELPASEYIERTYDLVPPGTPPKELHPHEVDYYKKRWQEYSGYYRNPQAYFIVHCMILEEIHVSDLMSRSLSGRGEQQQDKIKSRQIAYQMLNTLRDQLPEKESEEVSDYEKSLSVIHDAYTAEKKERYVGGVARLLSPEAIALAPNLIHKIDLVALLKRCGFSVITEDELLQKWETIPEYDTLPPDSESMDIVMKFFGYRLREKYAMKYNVLENDDASLQDNEVE